MPRSRIAAAAAFTIAFSALLAGCTPTSTAPTSAPVHSVTASAESSAEDARSRTALHALNALESRYDATLGVYAVDTGTGRAVGYRQDERFAYASTSKVLLAGALLAGATDSQLSETLHYTSEDLVTYSPVTENHVGVGLPLRDVIAAALQKSDNTAANLMFRQLGGPSELEKSLRALGDATTQVDRTEPSLNTATPGDIRDTSTPRALAADLRSFALGGALPQKNRSLLVEDLTGNATGDPLIRAGVPADWTVSDKSGAGSYGTRNDIAVVKAPHRAPIVMAILSRKPAQDAKYDNELIADAARVLATAFA